MKYYCYASFLDSKQKKQVSFYRHLQNVFLCCHDKLLYEIGNLGGLMSKNRK